MLFRLIVLWGFGWNLKDCRFSCVTVHEVGIKSYFPLITTTIVLFFVFVYINN